MTKVQILPKRRILLVDDEASFTRTLKLNLEFTGNYLVRDVNTPEAALAAACQFAPDIVLMDVMMQELDGGDIADRFRANPRLSSVPIVFVTAAVRPEELAAHDGSIGGLPFLRKPVDLPAVIECIERTCGVATCRPRLTRSGPASVS